MLYFVIKLPGLQNFWITFWNSLQKLSLYDLFYQCILCSHVIDVLCHFIGYGYIWDAMHLSSKHQFLGVRCLFIRIFWCKSSQLSILHCWIVTVRVYFAFDLISLGSFTWSVSSGLPVMIFCSCFSRDKKVNMAESTDVMICLSLS